MNHFQAQDIVQQAYTEVMGVSPSRSTRLLTQAWGLTESGYGEGWRGAGKDSHNWGAIQKGMSWNGAYFLTQDSTPQPDGTSKVYTAAYRAYSDHLSGCADLVRVLYKGRHMACLRLADFGDLPGYCEALYDSTYYEGVGKDKTERVIRRRWALLANCIRICRETGEPLADSTQAPETFRDTDGSWLWANTGRELLKALGHSSVKDFQARGRPDNISQAAIGLDGICGPSTWALLLTLAEGIELPETDPLVRARELVTEARGLLESAEGLLA